MKKTTKPARRTRLKLLPSEERENYRVLEAVEDAVEAENICECALYQVCGAWHVLAKANHKIARFDKPVRVAISKALDAITALTEKTLAPIRDMATDRKEAAAAALLAWKAGDRKAFEFDDYEASPAKR